MGHVRHQEQASLAAQGMDGAANRSIAQMGTIQETVAQQKELARRMTVAFQQVRKISERLLKVSTSEAE